MFIFNLLSEDLQEIAEQAHSPKSCRHMTPQLYLAELKDLFVVPESRRMNRWTFSNCFQKMDQSLEEYHTKLFRLYTKLGMNQPDEFISQFIEGMLNQEVRRKLIEENVESIQDCLIRSIYWRQIAITTLQYGDCSKSATQGLRSSDNAQNAQLEHFLAARRNPQRRLQMSSTDPSAVARPRIPMTRFETNSTSSSGDLSEILYQANQELVFGEQEGDQEIQQAEEEEIAQFWEDEDQQDAGYLCALTGAQKGGGGCWSCGRFGHQKNSCPL